MTINQRFSNLLHAEKINQKKFCEITRMSDRTISNIVNGRTKFPKSDFFEAVAHYFPKVNLRWLVLGEGEMYLSEGELSKARDIANSDRTKMINALGKKELELMDKKEQLEYLAELLIRVGKLFMELPPFKEEGGEKLQEIKRELEEGLKKVEGM